MLKYLIAILLILNYNADAQKTVLWRIKKIDSEKVSYMMGTLHQMGNWFIDEKPIIKELILKSDLVIFESVEDRKEKIVQVMNSRKEDFSYRNFIEKTDLAFLEEYTKDWVVPVSKQKPAELLTKLQQLYVKENCGSIRTTDTSDHMDDYLQQMAVNNNLKIEGLETYADQFDAINNIKEDAFTWDKATEAIHFWVSSLKNKNGNNKICTSVKEYMKLKFDYQLDIKCGNTTVVDRNQKWVPKIMEKMDNNNVFLAVGMFHLFGECGLIRQLRNQGYEVEPVPMKR